MTVVLALQTAVSSRDESCLVDGLQTLLKKNPELEVISTTQIAHEMLCKNVIQHSTFHLQPPSPSELYNLKLTCVVGTLDHNDMDTAVFQLVQAVALQGMKDQDMVALLDPNFFPVLYDLGSITAERRTYLNSKAMQYLGALNQKIAKAKLYSEVKSGNKVMVIGNGGREHAISWKLAQSNKVSQVFVVPGNGGTANLKKCVNKPCNIHNMDEVVSLAQELSVDFVCVGPEQPLVDGLVDKLSAVGIPAFGPSKSAAHLEGSKAFSKDFMKRHNIPTARYETFTDVSKACAHVESVSYPVVIKASGLAAGKGVVLPETTAEALKEVRAMMQDGRFGSAGEEVVIEERLYGEEVSVLAFCDGTSAVLMPAAQDHKRIFDGDKGPNTGGMGAIAPAPIFDNHRLRGAIYETAIDRTLTAARKEGIPFVGVLFTGFIITADGPKVLEYNCRFGDPETQAVLPLLDSDLFLTMKACVAGEVLCAEVNWKKGMASAAVMTASDGYPGSYKKGVAITGVNSVLSDNDIIFHSGTARNGDEVKTSGGRVLAVSSQRESLPAALAASYEIVRNTVKFDGMQFRSDIGAKSLRPPLSLGVIGSTRGTDMQFIIDAIDRGLLNARIKVVVSNKKSAYILERAKLHGLTAVHISGKDVSREEYDAKLTKALNEQGVDLVLLIGYMRILSDDFVKTWAGKCLNVHPSLLPDFAGGMDVDVHQAVIDAGKKYTGCTIHFVTSEVDGGPIALQRQCPVAEDETAATLKAKVQGLEGPCFVQCIFQFMNGELDEIRL